MKETLIRRPALPYSKANIPAAITKREDLGTKLSSLMPGPKTFRLSRTPRALVEEAVYRRAWSAIITDFPERTTEIFVRGHDPGMEVGLRWYVDGQSECEAFDWATPGGGLRSFLLVEENMEERHWQSRGGKRGTLMPLGIVMQLLFAMVNVRIVSADDGSFFAHTKN
ncbi:hypothetical protein Q7P37_001469 [Cladosporium fusiforme]